MRELISTKVTGSPGGYPVFIQRWTRMGHTRNNLEQMLLLGEPEAVAAVVHTPDLSHEIARRAWWAYPSAENARRLLEKPAVASSELGHTLAAYLLEFLPFEELPLDIIDTVRLCLQPHLISETERERLWTRAKRKNPFYVGFLFADAQQIPIESQAHPALAALQPALAPALADNNPYANVCIHTLSNAGQKWLKTLQLALDKPVDQDVVIALFRAIQKRFNLPFPEQRGVRDLALAQQRAQLWINTATAPTLMQPVLAAFSTEQKALLEAILFLAQLGEDSLNTVFGGNDSVGSVMRKRLEPLTVPILKHVNKLLP